MSAVETPVAGDVPLCGQLGKSLSVGSLGRSFDVWCPQRGEVMQLALSFRALVFRSFMFHKDRYMRIYAHVIAR